MAIIRQISLAFVESTYDAFDFDPLSEFCGICRYNGNELFEELDLTTKHGYKVTKYIYAMSHVDVSEWFERSCCTWSRDSNWMGNVVVSGDAETERIRRTYILVAWRGTRLGKTKIKVQSEFLGIDCSKGEFTRYNKLSAKEQVTEEIRRLVTFFQDRGKEVSLTLCGHSLGGFILNKFTATAGKICYGWIRTKRAATYTFNLLDGYVITTLKFRWNNKRDVALVNKSTDILIRALKIPDCWWGLVLNQYSRWAKPGRQPGHISSPLSIGSIQEQPPF
ncbi:hypothetical protein GQ457_14G008160 [Hibiscus cannabinus]